jgi:hypothetical protein
VAGDCTEPLICPILFRVLDNTISRAFCVLNASRSKSIMTMLGAMSKLTPTKDDTLEGGGYADILQSKELDCLNLTRASSLLLTTTCRFSVVLVEMVLGQSR